MELFALLVVIIYVSDFVEALTDHRDTRWYQLGLTLSWPKALANYLKKRDLRLQRSRPAPVPAPKRRLPHRIATRMACRTGKQPQRG